MAGEPPITSGRRLALAYLKVLGAGDSRDADQRLVWADLESFCHAYRPTPEKTTAFAIDEKVTLVNEGKRLVWMRARGQIIRGLMAPKTPKILKEKPQSNK